MQSSSKRYTFVKLFDRPQSAVPSFEMLSSHLDALIRMHVPVQEEMYEQLV